MQDKNKILILCKVVDNFGDIGVVYRLARSLSDLRPSLELTLVVSNLESFQKLAPKIDPKKQVQQFQYKDSIWKIIDWNLETETCCDFLPEFSISNFQFSVILECFQCGRPDWLEERLFSDDFTQPVQILNIDYLTAEDYAEDFHLLKSGTRKTNIKKRFFMPGFTEKTGGLIISEIERPKNEKGDFTGGPASPSLISPFANAHSLTATSGLQSLPQEKPAPFSIFFFAYEDNCEAQVKGIEAFQAQIRKSEPEFSVIVYVADGKSSAPFVSAWEKFNSPFAIEKIPFLPQTEFDSFITQMDFLFVRGEDSLARACLSGLPFVWQAYKQDENYQLVKVNALIERMKEFFTDGDFSLIKAFWQNYNDYEKTTDTQTEANLLEKLLTASYNGKSEKNMREGFKEFAKALHKNGNLAEKLLSYLDNLEL